MVVIVFILLAIYFAASYWAAGETIYANKIMISSKLGDVFIQKLITGSLLGWILIPVALIKRYLMNK